MANVFVEITDPHAILRYRQAGLAYFDWGWGEKRKPPATQKSFTGGYWESRFGKAWPMEDFAVLVEYDEDDEKE